MTLRETYINSDDEYGSILDEDELLDLDRLLSTSPGPFKKRAANIPGNEAGPERPGEALVSPENVLGGDPKGQANLATGATQKSGAEEPLDGLYASPKAQAKLARGLSVTDFVSPVWCELQYSYVIDTPIGKVRTRAMKEGSRLHQILEGEVHATIEVAVSHKEDAFGVRLWNGIQRIKSVQSTGLTREFEVWGIVDGYAVNGVIDELSTRGADVEDKDSSPKASRRTEAKPDITRYLQRLDAEEKDSSRKPSNNSTNKPANKVYISEVKTRHGKTSLPNAIAFRPAIYQLMIYRYLLSRLAEDKVDFSRLCEIYKLDADKEISETLVSQLEDIEEISANASGTQPAKDTEKSEEPITLRILWRGLIQELQKAMPDGSESIGTELRAEYRNQADGQILGEKCVEYDDKVLKDHLSSKLSWWKGEREAKGVPLEEAFKCRLCDFQDMCVWRIAKAEELEVQRAKEKQARGTSGT